MTAAPRARSANPTSTPRSSSCSCPATVAAAVAAHGFLRLFWFGAALVGAMTLVMTASRGGFVGLAMCIAVGAYLYRHLISYSRIAGWVFGSLIVRDPGVSFSQYGNLLAERIVGTRAHRCQQASSGRSDIWATLLAAMFANPRSRSSPVTAGTCTGRCRSSSRRTTTISRCGSTSGWSACSAAATCCSPPSAARAARACTRRRRSRGQLIAFVLGGRARVATAVFFVDLYKPWFYFWMYAGVVDAARVVRRAQPRRNRPATDAAPRRGAAVRRDPYGWTQPQRRCAHDARAASASSASIRTACCRATAIRSTSAAKRSSTCCWRARGAISATTSRCIVHDEGQGARRVVRRHHRHRGAHAPRRHAGTAVLPSARHASCCPR